MERRFTLLLGMIALFCISNTAVLAQENTSEKKASDNIIVVQKVTHEDGATTVSKKRLPENENWKAYVEELKDDNAKKMEIHIMTDDGSEIANYHYNHDVEEEGETLIFIRKAKEKAALKEKMEELEVEMEELKVVLHDMEIDLGDQLKDLHFFTDRKERHEGNRIRHTVRAKRPLLGVYVNEGANVDGLQLSGVVKGKGSATAGLQKGDVVQSINGNQIRRVSDLHKVLAQHNAGDQVSVTYTRGGQARQASVVLSEGNVWRNWSHRDPCKVFIGVQLTGNKERGVRITGIIDDTPASTTDLQRGDVILAMDGIEVNTFNELLVERNSHEPGDWFTLSVLSNGVERDVNAQFKSCDVEEEEVVVEDVIEEVVETQPVDLENSNLELEMYNAFPNPTYAKVTLRFQAPAVPTNIRVIDTNGKLIYKEDIQRFDGFYDKELNLYEGAAGLAFINIRQGKKIVTKKITLLPKA